jgi:cytochrome subunit of sulfide dehydrogenase
MLNARLALNAGAIVVVCCQMLLPISAAQQLREAPIQAHELRLLAAACATCHGTDGQSAGVARRLTGASADSMYTTLIAFRDGKQSSTIMKEITIALPPEVLRELATHFASVK